ncbi:MAG: prolipoprotein diacylglyceryl transferase [Sandaracinaceae bacterium]|nr:prolipoprotein diacylglyceryl transferase [Sandaracinaceae bacterium]
MTWNIDPVLGHLGPLEIRYYGLFFAIGLLLGARALPIYFERWGLPKKEGESLALWLPIGMILGAHYVHLIFYEPDGLTDFELPFFGGDRWGRFWSIGSGLASHGGGAGAILTLWIWAWRHKRSFWEYVDAAMSAAFWVIPFVRIGNFFNSEIVGRPWDGPWAVRFPRHDCAGYRDFICPGGEAPLRHPSQIYEALIAFSILGLSVWLQRKRVKQLRSGVIFLILLGLYFLTRTLVELVKSTQGVDDNLPLTMGQMLSIPIVTACLLLLLATKRFSVWRPMPAPAPAPADTEKSKKAGAAEASSASPAPKKKKKKAR